LNKFFSNFVNLSVLAGVGSEKSLQAHIKLAVVLLFEADSLGKSALIALEICVFHTAKVHEVERRSAENELRRKIVSSGCGSYMIYMP
jgi:hypothetical protein